MSQSIHSQEMSGAPEDRRERMLEAERVVKRLIALIGEHVEAARPLGIQIDTKDMSAVIQALRDHAQGGVSVSVPGARDAIHAHVLNRLFEELAEEPSNILYAKSNATGTEPSDYDAMNTDFWLECLELIEKKISA